MKELFEKWVTRHTHQPIGPKWTHGTANSWQWQERKRERERERERERMVGLQLFILLFPWFTRERERERERETKGNTSTHQTGMWLFLVLTLTLFSWSGSSPRPNSIKALLLERRKEEKREEKRERERKEERASKRPIAYTASNLLWSFWFNTCSYSSCHVMLFIWWHLDVILDPFVHFHLRNKWPSVPFNWTRRRRRRHFTLETVQVDGLILKSDPEPLSSRKNCKKPK